MTLLDPSARALLEAARDAAEPTAEDRAATQAELERRLGVTAFVLPAAATVRASAGAAKTVAGTKVAASVGAKTAIGGILLAKPVAFAIGAVVTAGVAWGVVQVNRPPSVAAPNRAPIYASPSDPAQIAPTPPVPPPATAIPATAIETMTAERAPAQRATNLKASSSATEVSNQPEARPAKSSSTKSTLGEEARLLQEVFRAMQHGEARRALDLLDEHATRFPLGSMRAEGSAERVLALCSLGRVDEAHLEAQRFFIHYPDAPLAERVRSSCAGTR